ncbi:MAG: hypothetical protein MMC33_008579 [Icmadophila ericetorum]|nr:hypothetical protein [Icmadophila ericetorum]
MQRSKPKSDRRGSNLQRQEIERPSISQSQNEQTPQEPVTEHHSDGGSAGLIPTTPNKRVKRDHPGFGPNSPLQPKPLDSYGMYTFNPKGSPIIDLTSSSPNGSPRNGSPMHRRTSSAVRPTNFTPRTGAKKLVVKNFRKTQKSSSHDYCNQVWAQVDASLGAIFSERKTPYSLEELYRGVENVCRQDKAESLYQKLCEKCQDHVLQRSKAPLLGEAGGKSDVELLQAVVSAWSTWNAHQNVIRSIFYYMDRSYLLHSNTHPSLQTMGIGQFRNHVLFDPALKSRTLQGACELVAYDRQGKTDMFDEELFGEAISMFHTLGVYTNDFEPKLLEESKRYFDGWSTLQTIDNDLGNYVDMCQTLLDSEISRCDRFKLDTSTKAEIVSQLEKSLIADREEKLVGDENVAQILDRDDLRPLRLLYSLLQRKGLGEKLRPAFEAHINKRGSEIVFDEKRENEMVVRLLQFRKRLDSIWNDAFERQEGLGHSLSDAFEQFINQTKKNNMTWGTDNRKPGEMIAKYVDMILKGGVKALGSASLAAANGIATPNEEDQDDRQDDEEIVIGKELDQVLDLFRFVHGKAVFEAFYKKDLARRLLMGRSASADAEKSMLTRLKSECGAAFTLNLEQMFTDIELAREEMTSYKKMLNDHEKKLPVDLNVNVLSASAWPTYPDIAVEVPQDIQKSIAHFEQYHKSKHTGHRLTWKHALAHCQLKANFPKGYKEIVVSSFQAIILLLFNGRPTTQPLSYSDIQAATNLRHEELERTLQSLACARYRVLTKSTKGKEINTTDTFIVNLSFSDPKFRIKINQIQLKETKEENKETHERVAADRHYETQAAIVRTMKARKKITHAELIAEVITATKSRGVLDPVEIKKNIEKLIEKDYIEREEGNSYSYLA